jgi:hypothetical protein
MAHLFIGNVCPIFHRRLLNTQVIAPSPEAVLATVGVKEPGQGQSIYPLAVVHRKAKDTIEHYHIMSDRVMGYKKVGTFHYSPHVVVVIRRMVSLTIFCPTKYV